jgi:hypothetical protein
MVRSGYRERGAKKGGAGGRRGELGDVDRGLVVRGVGGSTGCPEYRGVSRDKLQAGQRMREDQKNSRLALKKKKSRIPQCKIRGMEKVNQVVRPRVSGIGVGTGGT